MTQCKHMTAKRKRCCRPEVNNGLCYCHQSEGEVEEKPKVYIQDINIQENEWLSDYVKIRYPNSQKVFQDMDLKIITSILKFIMKKDNFLYKVHRLTPWIDAYCERHCEGRNHMRLYNKDTVNYLFLRLPKTKELNWMFIYIDENYQRFKKRAKMDPVPLMLNLEILCRRRSMLPRFIRNRNHDIHFLFI